VPVEVVEVQPGLFAWPLVDRDVAPVPFHGDVLAAELVSHVLYLHQASDRCPPAWLAGTPGRGTLRFRRPNTRSARRREAHRAGTWHPCPPRCPRPAGRRESQQARQLVVVEPPKQ